LLEPVTVLCLKLKFLSVIEILVSLHYTTKLDSFDGFNLLDLNTLLYSSYFDVPIMVDVFNINI